MVLIDGDILVYRVAASMRHAEYKVYTKDGHFLFLATSKSMLNAILKKEELSIDDVGVEETVWFDDDAIGFARIRSTIRDICDKTLWPVYQLHVTGDNNFRKELATIAPYKGQRPERPEKYQVIKDYLWSLPGVVISEGCEADDTIGIAACHSVGGCTIASIDKDLDMIPGVHYDFVKDFHYEVDKHQALRNFYRQMLTGDKIDNIIGLDGIGPIRAAKIVNDTLTTEEDMFIPVLQKYIEAYRKAQKEPDDASVFELAWSHVVENGKLLWIWRTAFDVWEPPFTADECRYMLENK